MAENRIRERISTLVSNQLPEFIRSDYTTFVSFIEAYYRFLEQDQGALEIIQNTRSYSDIDLTAESFVNYFLNNYAKDIPYSVLANKKLLVKQIRSLYESKGSEISFKLLFQLLYNEPVTVSYPYENVLKASDGEWVQKTTVRVSLLTGSTDDISDRYLELIQNGIYYRTSIISVKFLASNLYELTLEHGEVAPYIINDYVTVSNGTDIIFTGLISGTTTGASIVSPGTGFKVAQIFTVNVGGAVGTQVQVLGVDSNGGVTKVRILSYGYNFTEDIEVSLSSTGTVSRVDETIRSNTLGFTDIISLQQEYSITDLDRYFLSDYVVDSPVGYNGRVIASTATYQTNAPVSEKGNDDPALCKILLKVGVVGRYPGKYVSNKGFLSDDIIRLQNEKLYQPFAYQTESSLEYSKFYDIVSKLVHPAGQRLFNNRVLTNTINVASSINVFDKRDVFEELRDTFAVNDSMYVALLIPKSDAATVTDSLYVTWLLSKSEEATISDSPSLLFKQNTTEEVSVTESIALNANKVFTDNVIASDSVAVSLGRVFADLYAVDDSVVGLLINYADTTYFAETYAGEQVI